MLYSKHSFFIIGLLLLALTSACGTNNPSVSDENTDTPISPADGDPPDPTDSGVVTPTPMPMPEPATTIATPGEPYEYATSGNEIAVQNESELLAAINNAKAGDVITAVTGLYTLDNKVRLDAEGSKTNPIILRAADTRKAEITFSQNNGAVEGFVVTGSHWIIDGFVLSSDCTSEQHSKCEHAIHIKGGAAELWIRNNRIVEFNAAIKGSGSDNSYANDVRIEHNEIYNTTVRMTANPVTPIDINGGDGWIIRKNRIADFSKGFGNKVSYGAFLKANSSNGLFDSNWIQCEKDIFASGARIGLSFGGGGNKPIDSPICKDSDCSHLHRNGRMSNNLITNCSDVGIYINASSDTLIDHNTLYQTSGIDVRYETSTTSIVANLLIDGNLRERDGGQILQDSSNAIEADDAVSSLAEILTVAQPHALTDPNPGQDICGYRRQTPYIGAIGGNPDEQEACLTLYY